MDITGNDDGTSETDDQSHKVDDCVCTHTGDASPRMPQNIVHKFLLIWTEECGMTIPHKNKTDL